ncbi:MAG: hypothetical protein JWM74_2938 [Myxococcaceae bacterium]|nr:hypothetical protein [Myxococcaceae bacterium]
MMWRAATAGALLFGASLAGCSSCSKPSDPGAAAGDASVATTVSADAATTTKAQDASAHAVAIEKGDGGGPFVPTQEQRVRFRSYAAAMKAGRLATRDKRYDVAKAEFSRAIEAVPKDARARGERGYASLLAGELDEALEDLEAARALGALPEVEAQIWFNLGLVREKKAEPEAARAAFANADAIRPSAATAAKLVGKSRCTAEKGLFDKKRTLPRVVGFRGAHKAILGDELVTPDTEAAAKLEVCTHSNGAGNNAPGACDMPNGPWSVTRDYMLYTENAATIFPLGDGKMLVDPGTRVGGWPAHCTGASSIDGSFAGDFVHTVFERDGTQSVMIAEMGDAGDEWLGEGQACKDGYGSVTDDFYDRTGRHLVHLVRTTAPSKSNPDVTLTIVGSTIVLAGGGCNEAIDLAQLPKAPTR